MNSLIISSLLLLSGLQSSAPVAQSRPSCCAKETEVAERQDAPASFVTPWVEAKDRQSIASLNHAVATTEGGQEEKVRSLLNRPTVLVFVYSRCTNVNKCPLVARRLESLRQNLAEQDLANRVRLLAISYDPDYDTPDRLADFARNHDAQCGDSLHFLRIPKTDLTPILRDLDVRVSYNQFGVNLHRLECLVLDSQGRLVRNHHTVIWDETAVIDDLKRLLNEERTATAEPVQSVSQRSVGGE